MNRIVKLRDEPAMEGFRDIYVRAEAVVCVLGIAGTETPRTSVWLQGGKSIIVDGTPAEIAEMFA